MVRLPTFASNFKCVSALSLFLISSKLLANIYFEVPVRNTSVDITRTAAMARLQVTVVEVHTTQCMLVYVYVHSVCSKAWVWLPWTTFVELYLNSENDITVSSDHIDGDKFIDYPGWDFQMRLLAILMGWSILKRKCMGILLGQKRLAVMRWSYYQGDC